MVPPAVGAWPKQLKCVGRHLIWVLTQLPIEVRMIVRIHTALENLSILASVKEARRNPQRAYSIAASPSFTDFAAF
jgi:hypothetical protein